MFIQKTDKQIIQEHEKDVMRLRQQTEALLAKLGVSKEDLEEFLKNEPHLDSLPLN